METKGIRKIREGLKLLIEGKIEYTLEMKSEQDIREIRGIIELQNQEIQQYLTMAEERYVIPEEELSGLRTKYDLMKLSLKL